VKLERRTRLLVGLGLVCVAGVTAALLYPRPPQLHPDVLANVPAGAHAVARVDLGAVLDSRLWERVVVARGGDRGLRRIREHCGFDPAQQGEELVAFVTGDDADSLDHVTLLARGPFEHERLAECMRSVVDEEGASLRRTEIDGVPAVAGGRGDSRVAFLGRRGIVFGSEPAVREVIRTVRGEAPSMQDDEVFASLWERLARGREVVVAGRMPDRWKEVLAGLARRQGADVNELVAKVDAFGASASVSAGLRFGALLRTEDEATAEDLAAMVRAPIDDLLSNTLVSLSPAGPALRRIRVTPTGRELNVAAEYTDAQLSRMLDLLGEVERRPELLDRIRRER